MWEAKRTGRSHRSSSWNGKSWITFCSIQWRGLSLPHTTSGNYQVKQKCKERFWAKESMKQLSLNYFRMAKSDNEIVGTDLVISTHRANLCVLNRQPWVQLTLAHTVPTTIDPLTWFRFSYESFSWWQLTSWTIDQLKN